MERATHPPDALRLLTEVVREELDAPSLVLRPAGALTDLRGWDSLVQAGVVIGLERRLGRRFSTRQVDGLDRIEDLLALIADP